MLLWEEYKEKHPNGIMYTQFCDRYRNFKKDNQISMHKEHKAGEEVEVDWADDTMSYGFAVRINRNMHRPRNLGIGIQYNNRKRPGLGNPLNVLPKFMLDK
ncbi:MAG: hypothetical protein ACM3X9_10685 [Bacillota bacterium]